MQSVVVALVVAAAVIKVVPVVLSGVDHVCRRRHCATHSLYRATSYLGRQPRRASVSRAGWVIGTWSKWLVMWLSDQVWVAAVCDHQADVLHYRCPATEVAWWCQS